MYKYCVNKCKTKFIKDDCKRRTDTTETASILSSVRMVTYTVFQKKTSTHIIGYKLRNSCPILIIFDIKIPHII